MRGRPYSALLALAVSALTAPLAGAYAAARRALASPTPPPRHRGSPCRTGRAVSVAASKRAARKRRNIRARAAKR